MMTESCCTEKAEQEQGWEERLRISNPVMPGHMLLEVCCISGSMWRIFFQMTADFTKGNEI
jgi:hypothetical protein